MRPLQFAITYLLWPPLAWQTRHALRRGLAGVWWFHYVLVLLGAWCVYAAAQFAGGGAWDRAAIGLVLLAVTAAHLYSRIRRSYQAYLELPEDAQ